jgi:5-formyltetrahydrofolate cyclo-ligase
MTTKAELRTVYKEKRHKLGSELRQLLSDRIVKNALRYLADHPQIEHIHIFLPIKRLNEINTLPLIDAINERKKNLYTSISDHQRQEMLTIKLAVNQSFVEDKYGIPMPTEPEQGDEALVQLIFMPLLAYDLKGHRLGYGKGFYDRFLSKFSDNVVKAGLSFFPPEIEIPTEPHDIPLDICVSPEGVRLFK